VAVTKHKAISYELRSSEAQKQADGNPRYQVKRKNLSRKKPLPIPAVALSKAQGHQLWVHKLKNKLMVTPNFKWEEKKFIKKNTTARTGNGYEQAQGHQLWAYMLTIKLMVSSKLMWERKNLTTKIPLPVPAVALSKPKAMSCDLTCSHSSSLKAQYSNEKNKN
jgi:hypothetical protein